MTQCGVYKERWKPIGTQIAFGLKMKELFPEGRR
jgi:hypothetical protein